jgi:hypothetical protein
VRLSRVSEYSLYPPRGGPMTKDMTMRWLALAPLALIAVAMFSAWS